MKFSPLLGGQAMGAHSANMLVYVYISCVKGGEEIN